MWNCEAPSSPTSDVFLKPAVLLSQCSLKLRDDFNFLQLNIVMKSIPGLPIQYFGRGGSFGGSDGLISTTKHKIAKKTLFSSGFLFEGGG